MGGRVKPVSCRRTALRAGDRAGMLAGMLARGGTPRMSRDRARHLAGAHTVPEHWRPLFTKAFVKAALFAAHTDRDITASSKYGVD
jgi:hypothetical protein